eukprot:TRINITY_DN24333_c0_g1_i1.p1 TRINITY_DN24333_c0_g1~~TRINITY_DN24333_c0_g1_i1.p1  ORF type:complete len:1631 (+),score=438.00 TRINITY_DN24333_c0_g1_i1:218-5110(+)
MTACVAQEEVPAGFLGSDDNKESSEEESEGSEEWGGEEGPPSKPGSRRDSATGGKLRRLSNAEQRNIQAFMAQLQQAAAATRAQDEHVKFSHQVTQHCSHIYSKQEEIVGTKGDARGPTGLLHDFIARQKAQFKRDKALLRHRGRRAINQKITQEMLRKQAKMEAVARDVAQNRDAQYWLDRERLLSVLTEQVTKLWKREPRHPTSWPRIKALPCIATHFQAIVKQKTLVKMLKAEVWNWLCRGLLQQRLEEPEARVERHQRLQDFWGQFHGRHSGPSKPLTEEQEASSPSRRVQCGSGWKVRPARSRIQHKTWDWTQGGQSSGNLRTVQKTKRGPTDFWDNIVLDEEGASSEASDYEDGSAAWSMDGSSAATSPTGSPMGPTASTQAVREGTSFLSLTGHGKAHAMVKVPGTKLTPEAIEDMYKPRPYPSRSLLRWWKKEVPKEEDTPFRVKDSKAVSMRKSNSLPSLGPDSRKQKPMSMASASTKKPSPTMSKAGSSAVLSRSTSRASSPRSALSPGSPSAAGEESPIFGMEVVLPPIQAAPMAFPHKEPWQGKSNSLSKTLETPSRSYLKACRGKGVVPTLGPCVTGHSSKLRVEKMSLADADLDALTAMLGGGAVLEQVDLTDNQSLKDASLVPFIRSLAGAAFSNSLKSLSLRRCLQAGQATLDTVVKLLADEKSVRSLIHLDISHVAIGIKSYIPLARAIKEHPSLEKLSLMDTGLSFAAAPIAKQCIGDIMQSKSMTELDLSWNCFNASVMTALGEAVVANKELKSLRIANSSSAERVGNITPVAFLLEQLAYNTSLRKLDVSVNHIDFRGALVIEDAFANHKLEHLGIANNPLGVIGVRSFLRLLSQSTSGLLFFDYEGCSAGGSAGDPCEEVFNLTSPGGKYTLDLARPYCRALLRMLCKVGHHFKLSPNDCIDCQAYTIDGRAAQFPYPSLDPSGRFVVPYVGILTMNFTIESAMQASFAKIGDFDFEAYINTYMDIMLVKPDYRKIVPMLAQWKTLDNRAAEQNVFLNALSKDFLWQYPYIEMFCQSRSFVVNIIGRLLPATAGGESARYMSLMATPSLPEFLALLKNVRSLLFFNVQNPTGHYHFNLESPIDFAVAERLILLDRWEMSVDLKLKRVDASQMGNRSHCRNIKWQDRPLPPELRSIIEWNMPESSTLALDYSSGKRPTGNVLVIDDDSFNEMLVALAASASCETDQVETVRKVSHNIYMTSLQFRKLIGIYKDDVPRAELFILFFFRIVDIWNEKVFRVRFEDTNELQRLQNRLGYMTFFPFIQPEQAIINYDLSVHDERLAVNTFLNLRGKENTGNIKDFTYIREDGTVDPLPQGVPRSWEVFEKMPKGGVFKGNYICSPEDRNFKERVKLLAYYGYWVCPVQEDEIQWWAALNDAPEDVLEYVEYLSSRFDDTGQAFLKITGEDPSGQITLRQFDEYIVASGCHKFNGPDGKADKNRVRAVFRYLDPSGEGLVSADEWGMLQLLFDEIKLSITEFVQFLERTFGGDLAQAWYYLDSDGGGTIDAEEWEEAAQRIGFFGPTSPIFNFLDKDDEGDVSIDEFEELERFSTNSHVGEFVERAEAYARLQKETQEEEERQRQEAEEKAKKEAEEQAAARLLAEAEAESEDSD